MVSLSVGLLVLVVLALLYACYNSVYGGVTYEVSRVNLANARTGEVYNLCYEQPLTGERNRFLAKVLSVRSFTPRDLSQLEAHSRYRKDDPNFERGNTLVTVKTYKGEVRNLYANRCQRVRRPYFGRILFNMPNVAAYLL
jgi:hypothetical protein